MPFRRNVGDYPVSRRDLRSFAPRAGLISAEDFKPSAAGILAAVITNQKKSKNMLHTNFRLLLSALRFGCEADRTACSRADN